MAHPAALHLNRGPAPLNEMSYGTRMSSFHGFDLLPHFSLSPTVEGQAGVADNEVQWKGKLLTADEPSPEEVAHVLLSLNAGRPQNAALAITAAQPDLRDGPGFRDYAARPRTENRRKQKVGRSRSFPARPSSSGQRPHGGGRGAGQVCDNCGTTETPLWRKLKGTDRVNCNACGIHFNTKGRARDPTAKRTRGVVKNSFRNKVKPRNVSAGHLASLTRRSSQRLRHAPTHQNGEEDMLLGSDASTSDFEPALARPAMPGLFRLQNLNLNNASYPVLATNPHLGFTEGYLPPSYDHIMQQLMGSAAVTCSAFQLPTTKGT